MKTKTHMVANTSISMGRLLEASAELGEELKTIRLDDEKVLVKSNLLLHVMWAYQDFEKSLGDE